MSTAPLFDLNSQLDEHALARVLNQIETARGLPNACYTDPVVFALERQRVFLAGWASLGFAIDVPRVGDICPVDFAGMPLLMVRAADESVRVFHNVCRHRGRILVETRTNTKDVIVCPYHKWTYNLDGTLTGAPHVGGFGKHSCSGFNLGSIRLREVKSAEWFGIIFVDLSGMAGEFGGYIGPVAERWSDFIGVPLVNTGADCSIEFELDCNWKLAVENYCEAYHLPWVHPDLNNYSPLSRHFNIVEKTYSGQRSECYAPQFPDGGIPFPNLLGLPKFWETGAEYIALYPNALLGIHRDHFYSVLIQPDSPARTRERLEIFYYDDIVREPSFETSRMKNHAQWQTVFAEDRDAVESMQRGRASPGYDGGVFSPVMDTATHEFHCWIARALLQGR